MEGGDWDERNNTLFKLGHDSQVCGLYSERVYHCESVNAASSPLKQI